MDTPIRELTRPEQELAASDGAASGDPQGPDRGDSYTMRLRQLAHIELEENEAEALWHGVARHRGRLEEQLGRDVGQRVALLDLLVNGGQRRLEEPHIIARAVLWEIQQRAIEDALTGLYNRHFLESELARELERCRRAGTRSSLLLIDLDHFKEINDEHGHLVGDEVLRRVGAVIRESARTCDVPCRYGGDEFAIILPDAEDGQAIRVGERILRAVSGVYAGDLEGTPRLAVSASGGVACIGRTLGSAAEWIAWADRALAIAKRQRGLPARRARLRRASGD